jgi:hypothetical protein
MLYKGETIFSQEGNDVPEFQPAFAKPLLQFEVPS